MKKLLYLLFFVALGSQAQQYEIKETILIYQDSVSVQKIGERWEVKILKKKPVANQNSNPFILNSPFILNGLNGGMTTTLEYYPYQPLKDFNGVKLPYHYLPNKTNFKDYIYYP